MPAHLPSSRLVIASLGLALAGGLVVGSLGAVRISAQAEPVANPAQINSLQLIAIPPQLGEDMSLKAKPGEKIQATIRVRNGSDATLRVMSQASDFMVDDDGTTPIPLTGSAEQDNRWSLASWMVIAPAQQVLAPNQTGQLNVLIEVPEDALPGGHYAMVTHEPMLGSIEAGTTANAVTQRVGTLVYVMVEGDINQEAFVRDFQFPGFTEYGPVPYSFTVENRSDIHVRPRTKIEIRNWLGRKVGEIAVEPRNVFPLSSRQFEGTWDQVWGWGWHLATMTMSYGDQGQVVVARTSFWLLPIKLVMAIATIILALIAAGIAVRRHLLHRNSDQTKHVKELETRVKELESTRLKNLE